MSRICAYTCPICRTGLSGWAARDWITMSLHMSHNLFADVPYIFLHMSVMYSRSQWQSTQPWYICDIYVLNMCVPYISLITGLSDGDARDFTTGLHVWGAGSGEVAVPTRKDAVWLSQLHSTEVLFRGTDRAQEIHAGKKIFWNVSVPAR